MLMGIDIGNTNIKIGVIELNPKNGFNLITGFRLTTTNNLTSDELGIWTKGILRDSINRINPYKMKAIICSSVVPKLNHTFINMCTRYLGHNPYFIDSNSKLGLDISYPIPDEIGADRLVNSVAVNDIYEPPAIIIDFGTATTFCALGKSKGYIGGVIVPGVLISLDALSKQAAKLPQIELTKPAEIIGSSTRMGMVSGSYYSTIGTIEKICYKMKEEMNENNIKVIATGGLANFISKGTNIIDIVDPYLTMKGMLNIYKKNLDKFSDDNSLHKV